MIGERLFQQTSPRSLNANRLDEGLQLLVVLLIGQSPDSLPLQPFECDYLQLQLEPRVVRLHSSRLPCHFVQLLLQNVIALENYGEPSTNRLR